MADQRTGRAFGVLKRDGTVKFIRHPELVSGFIFSLHPSVIVARWMLKQVQHDIGGLAKR